MTLICGIDEAGKGPVIGDLVIAGCLINEKNRDKIKTLGAKDSKLLSRKKREELFSKITQLSEYNIVRISAEEIDARNSVGCNLNTLECMKMAQIINELNPDKAIIDCPHPIPEKFVIEIISYLKNKNIEIIAEHKADFTYPLVGAASILAKVTRDNHITELGIKMGIEMGSGYPADPKTRLLLHNYFNKNITKLKPYIRHSWSTYRNIKAECEQKNLFEC